MLAQDIHHKNSDMEADRTFSGVTLHGFPVRIELQWPFHRSGGGSDWHVMHGTVRLADGGPLHAEIALNLAQTIKEVLPSLDGDLLLGGHQHRA